MQSAASGDLAASSRRTSPLLTVTNRAALDDRGQDELYEFTVDGQRRTFGRDHEACDIIIWQAHAGRELARVAGEIWRQDDELWVRNLATQHEIGLIVPGQPPEQPLRVRRAGFRGPACSIPAPLASIVGPDGCLLEVQQIHAPLEHSYTYGLQETTVTVVPAVPEHLRVLAAALCEPLLRGHRLPAAYSELQARLSPMKQKTIRNQTDELCAHYTAASPQLAQRMADRRRRQEAAQAPMPQPVLRGAVYRYADADHGGEASAAGRRKGLSLPFYFEVAHLLVRHYRITEADLALLPPVSTMEGTP